jgi:hypothetical protein
MGGHAKGTQRCLETTRGSPTVYNRFQTVSFSDFMECDMLTQTPRSLGNACLVGCDMLTQTPRSPGNACLVSCDMLSQMPRLLAGYAGSCS